MKREFHLPELGENIEGGDVVNLLVAEGDAISAGQTVLELETEKAVVPVPCPHAGRVAKIHARKGARLSVGAPILTLEEGAAGGAPARAGAAEPAPIEKAPPGRAAAGPPARASRLPPDAAVLERGPLAPAAPAASALPPGRRATNGGQRPPAPAGPATRRLARQLGVDLYEVSGSGHGGRITVEDIKGFVRGVMTEGPATVPAVLAPPPLPDFRQWGEVERRRLGGIRRKTAEAMTVSLRTIPQVTQFDAADITELEAARRRHEERRKDGGPGKITVTVLAMKACVAAMKTYPQFNASLDMAAEEIIIKKYYNLGIAVDTEHGLLVPVIKDVDRKTIPELAAELHDLAARARERKLGLADLQGSSLTITNLGGIGGIGFTPIVNHPEVAILGISRAREEQVIRAGKPEVRLMLPICVSYDHRAIDGADGARFLRQVATLLADPFNLLLEL
jgi:pyruvate dehydrogenase E2 component (dihydrolipoamide acetyltransferase)